MSDMKTFTVRQLDREPATVLDEVDKEGMVRVRRRDGRTYSIQRESAPRRVVSLPDFAARRRAIFPKPIPKAQAEAVDRLIAGE